MRRYPLALALLLLVPVTLRAQPKTDPPLDYAGIVAALDPFIKREVADKRLPALSIALVDDQKIVWARGYGFADAAKKRPASADTVYRVGSVSKLFTDIAVMQLVEQGKLDLDDPVTKYLADFKPINRFDKPITLRMLMSHRSGLVREPPVGNYFDPSVTALDRTVQSLNQTELVYEPGTRTKYSNAGIAVVGRVIEATQEQRFARHLYNHVLDPLGMTHSAFEPTVELNRDLAAAVMWTYDGREFPAPTFELGMAPAGSMYSTVNDLGRFLSALFAGGKGPGGRILEAKTLEQMWTPQFAKEGEKTGFGIGFSIAELDGHKRIGHGGAIYGFATELAALPVDKLGVVVVTSRDVANGVTRHVASEALKQMLALREKKPLPKIEETRAIGCRGGAAAGGTLRRPGRQGPGAERARRPALRPVVQGRVADRAAHAGGRPGRRLAAGLWTTGHRQGRYAHGGQGQVQARAGRQAPTRPREMAGPHRRLRLGPQHALHLREGRPASGPSSSGSSSTPSKRSARTSSSSPRRRGCITARRSCSCAAKVGGRRWPRRPASPSNAGTSTARTARRSKSGGCTRSRNCGPRR